MKKVIRLTESDLMRIVRRVISEQSEMKFDRQSNAIMNASGIRPDKQYREVNQMIDNTYKNFRGNFSISNSFLNSIPLHLRALYYYLIGTTDTKTETILTNGEQDYLWDVSKNYGLIKGFNYNLWKELGASKLPTAITQNGIKAETERLKNNPSPSLISPGLAGEFMYTLGEISKDNIKKVGPDTIKIRDNYDFNTAGISKDEVMKQFTDTLSQFWKGTASFYSVIRKLVALKETSGYKGYPIEFTIKKPSVNGNLKTNDGVYRNFDRAYDYKKINGIWFTKQKNGTKWISLANNTKATKLLNSKSKNS
jgi:hypothetical protein